MTKLFLLMFFVVVFLKLAKQFEINKNIGYFKSRELFGVSLHSGCAQWHFHQVSIRK